MKITVSHIGRTFKLTAVTFCPEAKCFYRGETRNKDVAIPVSQARNVHGVIDDLERAGFIELDKESFEAAGC